MEARRMRASGEKRVTKHKERKMEGVVISIGARYALKSPE